MKLSITLFVISLLFLSSVRGAEVNLGAVGIPGLLTQDKSGTYDKILARVGVVRGKPINYIVLSPARAESGLRSGALDCIIPFDHRFFTSAETLLNSAALNTAKIYLFSRPGEGPYNNLEQLSGKIVGIRRGMPYGPKLDEKVKTEAVNNDDQNVAKLALRRIDAFLAYVPDMWLWAKKNNTALPNYSVDKPIDIHQDAFLCRDSVETRKFLQSFNKALGTMQKSGELRTLLGEFYVP